MELNAPTTLAQREDYARQAADYLGLHFTTVIDNLNDRVELQIGAWPLRLYLVGIDGRVLYAGPRGPAGYRPQSLAAAIDELLGYGGLTPAGAACYKKNIAAPLSIGALFGQQLASGTTVAEGSLPLELDGTRVRIRDSQGQEHPVPLFFASPGQVNYLLPAEIAPGPSRVILSRALGDDLLAPLAVRQTAPGIFTADSSGRGVAAANAVHLREGQQEWRLVFEHRDGAFVAAPIDLGGDDEHVVLVLYGTGLRNAEQLTARIGGAHSTVLYWGPQGQYEGLDQVNILLPKILSGAGQAAVELFADDTPANAVSVIIR